MHNGEYYELAMQDIFQMPLGCNNIRRSEELRCVNIQRKLCPTGTRIKEEWKGYCNFRKKRLIDYLDFTEIPGFYKESFAVVNKTWDVTIADYKLTPDKTSYEWYIKVGCRMDEQTGEIDVPTVVFFSQHYNVTDAYYDDMIKAGYDLGLGYFMDWSDGIARLDNTHCLKFPYQDKIDYYDTASFNIPSLLLGLLCLIK